ncbi:GntR family transcriptional regulator [Diplocloster agilis]|uniref:GntR family transcriptional regulator n=1 Tax=Diplocloster agilis TaxID=2850323 RepID=UPI0008204615|nr:GntR family transcriptional regulator [Suonthocola fibrivorans]MCU6733289.1 GntR family transcriptional regulator [Suonthocola fibrivorans]SCI85912.1 Arabinose metabolism transcriptional repressor [uncultured Clostridium sp.]
MKKMPLYKQIQEDIKQQIAFGSLTPGDRLPSEMDYSRKYFVSQITAKNALNGLVDEGYLIRIQGKGTFVANNPTKTTSPSLSADPCFQTAQKGLIGLLMPAMVTKVSQKLLNYIEKFVSAESYQLLFHITRESITDEAFSIHSMRAAGVKGLIIFPAIDEMYNEAILRLTLEKFPLVLVDRSLKSIPVSSVTSDNYTGVYAATSHLIKAGHKNISIISPKVTNSAVEERIAGYENFLLEHNILINKSNWCILDFDINETAYAFDYIKNFYAGHPEITAAICINAEMAQTTYYALKSIGKKIPEELELISFDQPYVPGVSYIVQNEEAIARRAVDLLLSKIEGNPDNAQIKVATEFIDISKADSGDVPYHMLYVLNQGPFST